ncbi:MAG: LytTR family transcriptional regulator DNA-binding domain-containing protein [Parasphingopyxis sp.]|uniref:LytTR family DNA-binding domain-containing protein n=1 Tax=Parasphingopyxis sp. TaxID=1920299 RepID=UPI003FA0B31D
MRQLAIEIFIIAAIGAVLGLLGPFGTYEMPTAMRLAYWICFILVGYAIYRPVQTVAVWLSETTEIPLWAALLFAAALAAIPLTAVVGFALAGMSFDTDYLGAGFGRLYLQVLGIGLGIQAGMWLLFTRHVRTGEAQAEPVSAKAAPTPLDVRDIPMPERPEPPFFQRLPPALGDHLVCLEMQDHYVKAHTLAGSEMLLMRLRDAIAELDGVDGLQVHRSWWVARDQVRAIRREGRGIKLELANGLLAPVARNRQEALRSAGWL